MVEVVVWWEQLFGLCYDSKADVCASISILSSAISSGLTCPGCHWITTGKSVSRMRVSLDYCIWTKSGLSPEAGNGLPWTFLRTQNPGKFSHRAY